MNTILIITKKAFPEGYASTTRFTSYCQGLIENNYNIIVHCIYPTENKKNVVNKNKKGSYKKINYIYTCGSTIRNKFFILRIIKKISGFINSVFYLILNRRKKNIQSIILIGPFGLLMEYIYYLIRKLLKIKFIQERTEYPYLTSKNTLFFKINLFFYLKLSCRLYDGMIVITQALNQYYSEYISKKAKILNVPIIVDTKRFEDIKTVRSNEQYIGYCGSMDIKKDGINILLEAFSLVNHLYPNLYLKLIGNTNIKGFNIILQLINELKISDKVIFTGRVSNNEMVYLLKNATLLALSRPINNQTVGNFPTKLGEYLATGNPVITTSVGVVKEYLKDNINAFIVEPSNAKDFATKIKFVLDNYKYALKVGNEGQKLAYTNFNYLIHGKRISDFITNL